MKARHTTTNAPKRRRADAAEAPAKRWNVWAKAPYGVPELMTPQPVTLQQAKAAAEELSQAKSHVAYLIEPAEWRPEA